MFYYLLCMSPFLISCFNSQSQSDTESTIQSCARGKADTAPTVDQVPVCVFIYLKGFHPLHVHEEHLPKVPLVA